MSELPRDTVEDQQGGAIRCPWCREDVGQASVTLEQLLYAHAHHGLRRADRERDGQPAADALTCACEACGRPFVVALRQRHGLSAIRLRACRTAADVALVGCVGARP